MRNHLKTIATASVLIATAIVRPATGETAANMLTQTCDDFNGNPLPFAGQENPDDQSFTRYVVSIVYALQEAQAMTGDQELLSPRNKELVEKVFHICKRNPDLPFADVLRDVLSAETR